MPSNAVRLSDFGSGIGTFGAVLQVDNTNKRIGIGTTNPQSTLQVGVGITMDGAAGVITATKFVGPMEGTLTGNISGTAAGLSGTPDITINNITGVAATFTGVVSYEDVNNVDSVGVVTARAGLNVVGGGATVTGVSTFFDTVRVGSAITLGSSSGIVTATTFSGALTGNVTGNISGGTVSGSTGTFTGDVDIADKIVHTGDADTAIRFPAANTFTAETAGSERLRITSSGRVVVGNDTERNNYDNGSVTSNLLHVERTAASGNAGISICANAETAADAGAIIYMGRTSANSNGGNTIVEDDDLIGRISFQGADGSQLVEAASIKVDVDGTPGANDMPGRIEFHTTPDGSAGATERLRIDSSGRLLIGETTSTSAGSIQAKTQIVSSDFNAALAIRRNQNSDGAPALIFFKNRGTSNSSNTVVQDDDGLGNIRFFGNDGTDFAEGAMISARVDGTPGSNDMPGALEFKTSADGAEAPVVKFTVHSTGDCTVNDGNLVIGTNGHGIDFSADGNVGGMTSELLDDYEEGTFTPTATNFTVSGTSTLTGQYVKIGRQVTIGIKFANTGTIAHATSAFIGGLPFSMASGTEAHGLIGMLDNNNSTAFDSNKSGTQCKLDGEGGSRFFPGSFTTTSSGGQLLFGGTYISAA